jgi:hypothetical protein
MSGGSVRLDRTGHVTFDELAQVPIERRRFGWVVVSMVRSGAVGIRGPTHWVPLAVIGFYKSRDDAIAAIGGRKHAGYKYDVCPFDDGGLEKDE